MIIRKNKRQLHGEHGPHTEYQKLARLGEVEGRDRNFKLGSIPSVLFSLTLSNGRLPYRISHSENSAWTLIHFLELEHFRAFTYSLPQEVSTAPSLGMPAFSLFSCWSPLQQNLRQAAKAW